MTFCAPRKIPALILDSVQPLFTEVWLKTPQPSYETALDNSTLHVRQVNHEIAGRNLSSSLFPDSEIPILHCIWVSEKRLGSAHTYSKVTSSTVGLGRLDGRCSLPIDRWKVRLNEVPHRSQDWLRNVRTSLAGSPREMRSILRGDSSSTSGV